MAQNTQPYVTVGAAAAQLGLSIADTTRLLDANQIESRTLVLRASLAEYQEANQ